jgi:hypothetical protein
MDQSAELCAEREISRNATSGVICCWPTSPRVETARAPSRQVGLERENAWLKAQVGERALERKKRIDRRVRRGPYAKVAARNAELLEQL